MTIISNPFAHACRHLLPKYTISTLRSIDIVDNQKDYGCILKFTRFTRELLRSYVTLYRNERLALQPPFILNSTQNYKFSAN